MAEDKKVTISRTLNGNTIYYIARNSGGTIFARELTQEALQKAIKTYREPPPVEEEKDEGKGVSIKGEETTAGETKKESKEKKFLTNKLAEKVQEIKEQEEKSQKKKSFWDKLK